MVHIDGRGWANGKKNNSFVLPIGFWTLILLLIYIVMRKNAIKYHLNLVRVREFPSGLVTLECHFPVYHVEFDSEEWTRQCDNWQDKH